MVFIVIIGISAPKSAVMAIHNIGCIVMVKALMPEEPNKQGLNSSLLWFETERNITIGAPMHSFAPTLISLAVSNPAQCPKCAGAAVALAMKGTKVQKQAAIEIASRYARIASQKGQRDMEKAWRIIRAELQPENAEEQKLLKIWLARDAKN
jgi:hypothetical protein